MDVESIIKEYLINNNFDGLLCVDHPCGCTIDNIAPCDDCMINCIPAYKQSCKRNSNSFCMTKETGVDPNCDGCEVY